MFMMLIGIAAGSEVKRHPRRTPNIDLWKSNDQFGSDDFGTDEVVLDTHSGTCRINSTGEPWRQLNDKDEEFVLKVVTANSTTWGSAKKMLLDPDFEETGANVVMIQEHRLLQWEIAEASRWANEQGWLSTFAPAAQGKGKKGAVAGVAILVRKGIGLVRDTIDTDQGHRVVCCTIEAPGTPPFKGIAAYYRDGIGATGSNLRLMNDIGKYISDQDMATMVAADWNMSVDTVAATGLHQRIQGRFVGVAPEIVTCTAGKEGTNIEVF